MADTQSGPGWSDAQWELIAKTVTEAFDKANVAGKFLPCYGPLPERDDYVRKEVVETEDNVVSVSDDTTLKLFTLAVNVPLSREQVRDEGLSSALLAFRRAAVMLAQVEDRLVFKGFQSAKDKEIEGRAKASKADAQTAKTELLEKMVSSVVTNTPGELVGLAAKAKVFVVSTANGGAQGRAQARRGQADNSPDDDTKQQKRGEELITAVSRAIGELEFRAHPGPFACVLGSDLFDDAHTPRTRSMVLPADRIKPLLRGPLLRSGLMDDATGILVSLSGTDIDLVVATPPRVQFLQVKEDAKYLFRVYEKFTMRIKDPGAIEELQPKPKEDKASRKPTQTTRKATKAAREPDVSGE
jgi:uncharacterized linocin/CFP29 family protein